MGTNQSPAITEYEAEQVKRANKIPGCGHGLTIDGGWQEVADTALAFVQKHGPKT